VRWSGLGVVQPINEVITDGSMSAATKKNDSPIAYSLAWTDSGARENVDRGDFLAI